MNLSNAALTGEGEDRTKSEQRVAAAHPLRADQKGAARVGNTTQLAFFTM